jgi:hypothetical protein
MKVLFLFLSLSITIMSFGQIGEVKQVGSYAKIYNEKGQDSGHSIYLGSNGSVEGYNSEFIVVKEGSYAKIYNDKGNNTGHSIYLGSNNSIKHVSQTAILVKEGSYVKYYDFNGRNTGKSTYDPK